MESTVCPLCRTPLELKQISFTAAIYICTDLKCPYPVDHKCFVVERHLEGTKNNLSSLSPVKQSGKLEYKRSPELAARVVKTEKTPNDDFDLKAAISNVLESFELHAVEDNSFNLDGNASVPPSYNSIVAPSNNSVYNDEFSQSENFAELQDIFNSLA